MVHIAFVDITYGYTADRPELDEPLGGTTSAVCFLAQALQKAGVTCTIFNKVTAEAVAHGIRSLPLEALTEERHSPVYSAFVFCGRWADWLVAHIAEATRAPLIAWMHESQFGGELVPPLPQFKGIVFVSDWQARVNQAFVGVGQKTAVIRNAMGGRYEAMFPPDVPITANKKPLAVYIGSTPRGLVHLPALWPLLQAACPTLELQIYSNPDLISRNPAEGAAFAEHLRAMPNVTHVGMVGQPTLAEALRHASFYLAPNPYPETSCIALIESMAAGLCCITTNRAALPETAHGYSTLFPIAEADDPLVFTQPLDVSAFAQKALTVIQDRLAQPQQWEEKLRTQISYFQAHYCWSERVHPWLDFLKPLS